MPIVIHLGRDVKEYREKSEKIILQAIAESRFGCEFCLRPMTRHSNYDRRIKETGQSLTITVIWCKACKNYHALLPDFLLPRKHYSANEIEGVIIDSGTLPINQIDTEASESTVRRWLQQIVERIKQAVGILKYLFGRAGQAVGETAIDAGHCYSELEQVLEKAPREVRYSGNKLGLANLWLGTNETVVHI